MPSESATSESHGNQSCAALNLKAGLTGRMRWWLDFEVCLRHLLESTRQNTVLESGDRFAIRMHFGDVVTRFNQLRPRRAAN